MTVSLKRKKGLVIGHEGGEKMNRSIKSGGKKLSGLNANNGIENRSGLCLSLLIHPLPMKQVSISVEQSSLFGYWEQRNPMQNK